MILRAETTREAAVAMADMLWVITTLQFEDRWIWQKKTIRWLVNGLYLAAFSSPAFSASPFSYQ